MLDVIILDIYCASFDIIILDLTNIIQMATLNRNLPLDIANETIEQVKRLIVIVRQLSLTPAAQAPLLTYLDQCQIRLRQEPLQLDTLKLQLVALLEQALLTPTNLTVQPSRAVQLENTVLNLYDELDGKLPINEQIVNLKVVIVIMDFKLNMLYQSEPRLSLEEILLLFDELNLWHQYKTQSHSYIRYFYLCLIYEYFSDEQVEHGCEAVLELVQHLLKWLENETSQSQSQQLLVVLLHMHLIIKYMKKYRGIRSQLPRQQHIYTMLYELDGQLGQKIGYGYKKTVKSGDSCVKYAKEQLKLLIVQYDESTIREECKMEQPDKRSIAFRTSSKKRISLKGSHERGKVHSLKKLQVGELKVNKNMFVPKTIKGSTQLHRKLQLRKDRIVNSHEKLDKFEDIRRSTGKQTKIIKKADEPVIRALSYQACKKASLNKNLQMELMICMRPGGQTAAPHNLNLMKNTGNLDKGGKQNQFKPRRMGRKKQGHFSGSHISQINSSSISQKVVDQPLRLPPTIHKIFQCYLLTLRQRLRYQHFKQNLPLLLFLKQLKIGASYLINDRVIVLKKIMVENRFALVSFQADLERDEWVKVNINEDVEKFIEYFKRKDRDTVLNSFYFIGKAIQFYTFKIILSTTNSRTNKKMGISEIADSSQIYSHQAHLSHQFLPKYHIKKILAAQANLISSLNKSVQLQFDYSIPPRCHLVPKAKIQYNKPLLSSLFKKSKAEWMVLYQQKKTMKVDRRHIIVHSLIMKRQQTGESYLRITALFLSLHFDYKVVLPIRTNSTDSVGKLVTKSSKWSEFKQKVTSSKHLFQRTWHHLQINQRLLQLPIYRYVIKRDNRYTIIKSQTLIKNQLLLISGDTITQNWLILIEPKQLLLKFQNFLSLNKHHQKRVSAKLSRKSIGRNVFSGSLVDIWRADQIKNIKIDEKYAYFDRNGYLLRFYSYSWLVRTDSKLYICFWQPKCSKIFMIKRSKQFIYFGHHIISEPTKNKELLYEQFRAKIKQGLTTSKLVFPEWQIVTHLRVQNQTVVCSVHSKYYDTEIVISAAEMCQFYPTGFKIRSELFRLKSFMKRVELIFRVKFQGYLDHIF